MRSFCWWDTPIKNGLATRHVCQRLISLNGLISLRSSISPARVSRPQCSIDDYTCKFFGEERFAAVHMVSTRAAHTSLCQAQPRAGNAPSKSGAATKRHSEPDDRAEEQREPSGLRSSDQHTAVKLGAPGLDRHATGPTAPEAPSSPANALTWDNTTSASLNAALASLDALHRQDLHESTFEPPVAPRRLGEAPLSNLDLCLNRLQSSLVGQAAVALALGDQDDIRDPRSHRSKSTPATCAGSERRASDTGEGSWPIKHAPFSARPRRQQSPWAVRPLAGGPSLEEMRIKRRRTTPRASKNEAPDCGSAQPIGLESLDQPASGPRKATLVVRTQIPLSSTPTSVERVRASKMAHGGLAATAGQWRSIDAWTQEGFDAGRCRSRPSHDVSQVVIECRAEATAEDVGMGASQGCARMHCQVGSKDGALVSMPSKAVSQALVAPPARSAAAGEGEQPRSQTCEVSPRFAVLPDDPIPRPSCSGNDTTGHARKDAATDRARPICEIGKSAQDKFRTTSTRAEALCTGRKGIRLGAGRPPPQHAHFEGVRFMPPADRSHLVPMPFDDELSLVTLQPSSPDPDLSLLHQSVSTDTPCGDPASIQRALPDATNITSPARQSAPSGCRTRNQADEEVAEPTISRRAHLRALKEAQEHFKAQLAKEIADLRARVSMQTDFQSPSASRRGPPGDFRWTTTQDLATDVTDPSLGGLEDVQAAAGEAAEVRPGWKSRMFPRTGFARQNQIRQAASDDTQHRAGRLKRTPSPPPPPEASDTVSETESEGVHTTSDASSQADEEAETAHRICSRGIPRRYDASAMLRVSKTSSRMQISTQGGKAATTSKVDAPENDSVTESDEDDPSVSHLHNRNHHLPKRSQRPKAARTSAKDSAAGRSGKRPSNNAPSSNATIEREAASASKRSRIADRSFSEPNLLGTAGNENASAPSSQPARRAQKKKTVKSGLPCVA
ncbi:hypothetical protein IE81DRAFT_67132 [Ceraceosorus guamensis]|uniref:Uncharacterized protein n=1 Tax=Ceraceosorus guamensis TaxID=1522189 RepID=A0A316W3N5_9BASI|nr:hypothetical protein IE81DRAFT_67132 [Ceraceosorus guamensis]PWN43728.1 hypothetical protein IE81DRAFT_67132 [Ceraceosorus guamensis]